MEKSIEERLADIEGGITKLEKMQDCVFNLLLTLHARSSLVETSERATASIKESLEFVNQRTGYSIALMFGGVAMAGVAISLFSLYFATLEFDYKATGIAFLTVAVVLLLVSLWEDLRARSQLRVAKRTLSQTGEDLDSAKEKAKALDDDLTKVIAEWKELNLVPDDLVSESRNSTSGPKDSHSGS